MSSPRDRALAFGDPDALRSAIAEMLALAQIQAGIGEDCADSRDDAGLRYHLRRLSAYLRAAIDLAADLQTTGHPEAQR